MTQPVPPATPTPPESAAKPAAATAAPASPTPAGPASASTSARAAPGLDALQVDYERLNRLIAQSVNDCTLLLTTDGRIQQVGESTIRLLELADPLQLLGMSWLSIWEAPERSAVRDAVIAARQGNTARFSAFGYTLRRTPKWWDVVVSPVDGNATTAPKLLLAVVRDVTELHLREQQIRELNAQLEQRVEQRTQDLIRANYQLHNALTQVRDLYDRAPCGYMTLDREGCFEQANQTALGWLGLTAADLGSSGKRLAFRTLLAPEEVERFANLMRWLLSGNASDEQNFELRGKSGRAFSASINATPVLDFEGRFVSCRLSMVDITARRRAESALKRSNRELEAANAELESFSYTVSHDLRAPLRHVHHFVEMGLDAASGPDGGAAVLPFLEQVLRSLASMGKLIDGLLDLARLGRTALREMPVPMGQLVGELVAALRGEAAASLAGAAPGAGVEWVIAPDLPTITCDAVLVRQVWNNVLGNAVKYSRKREAPRVEVAWRMSEAEPEYGTAPLVEFIVTDNGAGFDPRGKEKLFVMFQRLHSDSEFEGNGIGLALTRKIIERHGGRIWAEGEKGVGCTMHFTLPLSQ